MGPSEERASAVPGAGRNPAAPAVTAKLIITLAIRRGIGILYLHQHCPDAVSSPEFRGTHGGIVEAYPETKGGRSNVRPSPRTRGSPVACRMSINRFDSSARVFA